MLCSHLKIYNADYIYTNTSIDGIAQNGIDIIVRVVGQTSNDENWRTWLASNPITVVYELAEEVTEDLPIADQIALNSLATYDGITYLEFDSEIKPTFEGEYGTSKVGGMTLESLLTARNNDLRLSSLEASVVNNI